MSTINTPLTTHRQHNDRRRGRRRLQRLGVIGLAGAVALSAVPAAAFAAEFNEIEAAWITAPAEVTAGSALSAIVRVNTNGDQGAAGTQASTVVSATFENLQLSTVPAICAGPTSLPAGAAAACSLA